MTLGSLFSGVGGFDLGFERAGMQTAWQVEIEPFCKKVLAARFPNAERFDDVLLCGSHNLKPVDVLCGGSPCQGFSVAGKRGGLDDERSGLFRQYARILRELRPAWFVFENVPGLLSQNNGRDFAEVLRIFMVDCGYGVSWRVLNSQFFGVAQRRRRLFVVGSLGRPCPASILFESESGRRDSEAGEETWESVAGAVTGGIGRVGSRGADDGTNIVRQAISSKWAKGSSGPAGDEHHNLIAAALTAEYSEQAYRGDGSENIVAATLTGGGSTPASHGKKSGSDRDTFVATLNSGGNAGGFRTEPGEHLTFGWNRSSGNTMQCRSDVTDPLRGNESSNPAVCGAISSSDGGYSPDRAASNQYISTPPDSDRMRSFAGLPVGLDSARYRALGNAVTVSVAEWIGRRLVAYQEAHNARTA